jgi:hypothetical protein
MERTKSQYRELTPLPPTVIWGYLVILLLVSLRKVARAFLIRLVGLVAWVKVNFRIPKEMIGVGLFAILPFIITLPYLFTFQINEYYTDFKYYWLTSSGYIHAAITIVLLRLYKNYKYFDCCLILSVTWMLIIPIMKVLKTENQDTFTQFLTPIYIYSAISIFLILKTLLKDGFNNN